MHAIKKLSCVIVAEESSHKAAQKSKFSAADKRSLKSHIIASFEEFREGVTSGQKDFLRSLHLQAKDFVSSDRYQEIWRLYNKHSEKFLDGKALNPEKIKPSLRLVEHGSSWAEIFKVVRHTWSIPYSKGYGRRMRFVIYDEYHDAVIGILGFQSPPADLACRDSLFNYPDEQKLSMVNRTMDVFTIGAIPPYSNILGGKLIAGLVCADEIRKAYWKLYAGKRTVMQDSAIEQPLVGVTTTSVYGRSSIYNRLRYKDRLLAEPIGYTKGFGTIHLENVYPEILRLLRAEQQDFASGGFGTGPKIRWQHYARAFTLLGLPSSYFEHGLQREVFLFRFVEDLDKGMSGKGFGSHINLSVNEYTDFWKERWAIPRSKRIDDWKTFEIKEYIARVLKQNCAPTA
jgi:hypothetical protein